MTEHRKPTISITTRFAQKQSKKTTKIDLFIAHIYATKWQPWSDKFHPKPPLHSAKRKEWWETRYRVRIDGVWYGDRAKYQMFTKAQIYQKWLNF